MIKLLLLGMLKAWWLLPVPIMLIAGITREVRNERNIKKGF